MSIHARSTRFLTEAEAHERGFTKEIYADGGCEGGRFLVKPDADLDGYVRAFSLDWDPTFYTINGCTCLIEEA